MKKPAYNEGFTITKGVMEQLINFPIEPGIEGANLRSSIGQLLGNFPKLVQDGLVGTQMLLCFDNARIAGATLTAMDNVRNYVFSQTPKYVFSQAVSNAAMIFSLSEQTRIISAMTFVSRNAVEKMIDKMSKIIDDIKLHGSQTFVVNDYRNVVAMSAALIYHLSETERVLPRVVVYHLGDSLPGLTVSNRIYYTGSRCEQLIAENRTVHPAFMRPDVIALSA